MRNAVLLLLTACWSASPPAPPPDVPTSTSTTAPREGAVLVQVDAEAVTLSGAPVLALGDGGAIPAEALEHATLVPVRDAIAARREGQVPLAVDLQAPPALRFETAYLVANAVLEGGGALPSIRVRDGAEVRAVPLAPAPPGARPTRVVRADPARGFVVSFRKSPHAREELHVPCKVNGCPALDTWDTDGLREAVAEASRQPGADEHAYVSVSAEVPWQVMVHALDALREVGATEAHVGLWRPPVTAPAAAD